METIYTDIDTRLRRAADGNVRTHLRKLEKEGRVKVHPGKPRERPAAEVESEREEEHARQEVIKKAEEYQRQARLRALFLQENPPLEQWEEMPRYERTA
jgi:hypothetical protein